MGRTRVIVESFLFNAVINLALSVLLIPSLGITGAAIAVSISNMAANVLLSARLYQLLKIHPLTRNYLVSVASSAALLALSYAGLNYLDIVPTLAVAAVSLVAFLAAYVLVQIALKAVDKEDLMLLAAIEKRLGLHIVPVKSLQ
jgi:O-antigen/teichoic acid export membrane protein